MKKILIAFFCFLSLFSKGQVYQSMPQYGYAAHRMSFDSTLQIPTFCGVPTLKSNVLKFGAIAFDSCNNRFYFYNPKTAVWDTIKGGGGSSDTTSLSNRINLKLNISDTSAMLTKYLRKIDTTNKFVNNIARTLGKDSIIYFIGSTRYAIKDSVGTNPAPVGYYGAFQDTINQTAAVINTGYPMKLRVNDLTNGVTIVSDSRITIANTGIYNLQWSAQFTNPLSAEHDVTIWLRKNGVDVPGSSGIVLVPAKHGSSDGHTLPSWNFLLSAVGGDYYEFVWSTANTSVYISYSAAGNPPPSTASVVLTVTQQSGIMAGTGMTALNGLTGAVQTFALDSTNTTFKITSSGTAHTFNIPNASASGVTRGLISNTQYTTFNGKIGSGDTATMLTNYINLAGTGLTKTSQTIANNLSTGVSGGQSVIGGTVAGNSLTLSSTSNATKGKILFGTSAYDEVNNRLGIGTNVPATPFEISGNSTATNSAQFGTIGIQSYAINNAWFGDNIYFDGSVFRRRAVGYAGLFYFQGQEGQFRFGTTSTAGSVVNNGSSSSGLVSLKTNLNGTFAVGDLSAVSNTYTGAKFIVFGATGNAAIGTATDNGFKLDVIGTARASQFQLSALNTAPATATSTGTLGEIRIVNGFIYVCVATNTWQRAAIATW